MTRVALAFAGMALIAGVAFAQDQKPEQGRPAQAQNQPERRPISASARLAAARTVFVRNATGSDIPFNVITEGIDSWGRFTRVNTPEKADIVVEVSSPDAANSVTMSSRINSPGLTGREEHVNSSTRQLSNGPIRIIVYDAKSHVALWSASEQAKFGMKQKTREDNLVQAAQRLFNQLRERVEPQQ